MLLNDKLRSIKTRIIRNCSIENEINLVYFMNESNLHIYNDLVRLDVIDKVSLTNFNKLLSLIKNDYELERYNNKIKSIEIYN